MYLAGGLALQMSGASQTEELSILLLKNIGQDKERKTGTVHKQNRSVKRPRTVRGSTSQIPIRGLGDEISPQSIRQRPFWVLLTAAKEKQSRCFKKTP